MTDPYHKIPTVFKRDPANKYKTLLLDEYATPELKYLADNMWYFSEKIDGTNIRVMYDASAVKVTFGGRTERAQLPAPLWAKLVDLFPESLFQMCDLPSLTLYGEGYGKGIQKVGGLYLSDTTNFTLFDVKIGGWWLKRDGVFDIAKRLSISTVPDLGYGSLMDAVYMAMRGFTSHLNQDMTAEGLVMRPTTQLLTREGHRIIAKIKCKDFPRPVYD